MTSVERQIESLTWEYAYSKAQKPLKLVKAWPHHAETPEAHGAGYAATGTDWKEFVF